MKITGHGPPISISAIEAFEDENHIALPREYRDFLLEHNGGCPYPNACKTISGVEVVVSRFFSLGAENKFDDLAQRCWSSAWTKNDTPRPIQVGYDIGGQELMLCVDGSVFLVIGNDAHLCAESFEEFLAKLERRDGILIDEAALLMNRIFGGE